MPIDSPQVFCFDQIIGQSPVMQHTIKLARRVAKSEVSCVLLQGESGVGKDCLARAIHHASRRADAPFVAINCAALPAKLLRVLEEGMFRRVGGLRDVPFTARVIAATNRNLKKETECCRFRLDLYFRLAIVEIDIAPLRDRGDDVLLLAEHCLEKFGPRLGRENLSGVSPEVMRAFKLYYWPGNVRELRNVIERAIVLEDSEVISPKCLPAEILMTPEFKSARPDRASSDGTEYLFRLNADGISLEELEDSLLKQALTLSNGNQTRAARLLGLSRDQFRYRWKKIKEKNRPRLVAVAAMPG